MLAVQAFLDVREPGHWNFGAGERALGGRNDGTFQVFFKSLDLVLKNLFDPLAGVRRAFPVASYLAYSLSHVEKRAFLLDGVAGMTSEQSWMLGPEDVVIAVSFRPYARQTAAVAETATANGSPLIAISDSRLSPVAKDAAVCFEIKDAEVRQFRSLTASMCLAQTLVISYAYKYGLEAENKNER